MTPSNTLLYLSCPARAAFALVDELTDVLNASGIQAQVLKYGITTKAHDGFIMLGCPQGFPKHFVEQIHQDLEITDYVLCQNTSDQTEGDTPMTTMTNQREIVRQDEDAANVCLAEQVQLPVGFVQLAAPMLLLGPGDGRYIVRVYAEDYQTDGILVYEDCLEVAFFSADEAVIQAMYILREAWPLLAACDPTISLAHADAMQYIREHRELQ